MSWPGNGGLSVWLPPTPPRAAGDLYLEPPPPGYHGTLMPESALPPVYIKTSRNKRLRVMHAGGCSWGCGELLFRVVLYFREPHRRIGRKQVAYAYDFKFICYYAWSPEVPSNEDQLIAWLCSLDTKRRTKVCCVANKLVFGLLLRTSSYSVFSDRYLAAF